MPVPTLRANLKTHTGRLKIAVEQFWGDMVSVVPVCRRRGDHLRQTNSPWTGSSFPVCVVTEAATQATCTKAATGLCWANHPTRILLSDYENQNENLQGDSNTRCTHGRENVDQSKYMPEAMCASPEGGSSNREAQAIVTQLEPPAGMPVKKSRIL